MKFDSGSPQASDWQRVFDAYCGDLPESLRWTLTIEDIAPGTAQLHGDPRLVLGHGLVMRVLPIAPSWADVASLLIHSVALINGMGPKRFAMTMEQIRSAINADHDRSDFHVEATNFLPIDRFVARTIGDVVPGIERLQGDPRNVIVQGRAIFRILPKDPTWSDVAAVDLHELRRLAGIGPKRFDDVISSIETEVRAAELLKVERDRMQELAAGWTLEETCDVFLNSFDERDRVIIRRILDVDRPTPTLAAIGLRLGLTRERVRQLESKLVKRIHIRLRQPEFESILERAQAICTFARSRCPIDSIPSEIRPTGDDLASALVIWAAGPYVIEGGWIRRSRARATKSVLRRAFDRVADDDRVCFVDDLRYELEKSDVDGELLERLIDDFGGLRVIGGRVVDWKTSYHQKAVALLRINGVPMTTDELVIAIEPTSPRSLLNQVSTDPRIARVGRNRFALAEWNLETYDGIVPMMISRLADGPRAIEDLASELATEFGISPASVRIHSSMHPAFIAVGGIVRHRRADEPYVSTARLEDSRMCEQNDEGDWLCRLPIDHDLLRGSGIHVPEAFAIHLGVEPLGRIDVESSHGAIPLSWWQTPAIGSLRSIAIELGGRLGDDLLIAACGDGAVEFSVDPVTVVDERDLR